jgi:hypothetical protein
MLTSLLLTSIPAMAWGCTGHEVIALIALKNLQPAAATQVESILATQPRDYSGRYCSDLSLDPIAYYATWADDYRTGHPETAPWHFWDIPLKQNTAGQNDFCDQGCVTQALQDQLATLKDSTADPGKRADALKFVIHFVGDLHQPLHEEDNNDRGGNCVPATFLTHKTKETNQQTGAYTPNLHGIWDTELVEYAGGVNTRTTASVKGFANTLMRTKASTIREAANEPVDFVAWALQSHAVAQRDPYAKLPKKIAVAQRVAPVNQCSDHQTSETLAKKKESVQTAYINRVKGDLQTQLARAGGRLAAVLNSALVTQ